MNATARLLKNHGLRRTPARATILQILTRAGRPLSHPEILKRHKGAGSFDRVTVYRTLETLVQAGLLHRIQGTDGAWRYCRHRYDSPGKCAGNHIHFLCAQCGRMSCLPEQILPWVEAPAGAQIHSKQLVVHGLCAGCAAASKIGVRGRGAGSKGAGERGSSHAQTGGGSDFHARGYRTRISSSGSVSIRVLQNTLPYS
jgi:Fur family transcriptional regulator, ferric uptake regulator